MLCFNTEKEYQRIFKKIILSDKFKNKKDMEVRNLMQFLQDEISLICKRMSKRSIKKIISNKSSSKVPSYSGYLWRGDTKANHFATSLCRKTQKESQSSWSNQIYYTDIFNPRDIKKICFEHRYYVTIYYKEDSVIRQRSFKKTYLYRMMAEYIADAFAGSDFFSSREFAKFMIKNGEGLFLYMFLEKRTNSPLRSSSYYLEDNFQKLLIKRLNDNTKSERLKNKLCRIIFKQFSDLNVSNDSLSENQIYTLKRNAMVSFYHNPLSYLDLNVNAESFSHYVNRSWTEEWYIRDFILSTLKIKVLNMSKKNRLKYAHHFSNMTREVTCSHSKRIFTDILSYTMSLLPRKDLIFFMDVFSDRETFNSYTFSKEQKRLNQELWR